MAKAASSSGFAGIRKADRRTPKRRAIPPFAFFSICAAGAARALRSGRGTPTESTGLQETEMGARKGNSPAVGEPKTKHTSTRRWKAPRSRNERGAPEKARSRRSSRKERSSALQSQRQQQIPCLRQAGSEVPTKRSERLGMTNKKDKTPRSKHERGAPEKATATARSFGPTKSIGPQDDNQRKSRRSSRKTRTSALQSQKQQQIPRRFRLKAVGTPRNDTIWLVGVAGVDEGVDVAMQFVVLLLVDIDHVT